MTDNPRGIRNHNPLNLDFIAPPERAWNGQVGQDGPFGVYSSPDLGVRAGSHQLQKDFSRSASVTLADLITEWAPPATNDTEAYITAVAEETKLDPSAPLNLYANLPAIVTAMIRHENGQQPYAESDIAKWVYLV